VSEGVHEMTLGGGTPSADGACAGLMWIACVDGVTKGKWMKWKEYVVWAGGRSILGVW